MDWFSATKPLIIGHRGASADATENTLAAFHLAREQGAEGVELDVQLSADGWPVVMHDEAVDRTTSGQGQVGALKLADLKALTVADGQQIPTLAEVFEELGPDFLYNVELKDYGVRDSGLATAVSACVRQFGFHKQVLASSFSPLTARRARHSLAPETGVGLIRYQEHMKAGHWLFKAAADHPHYSLVDAAYIEWAKAHSLRIHVWTVDDPAEAQRLLDLGVHGLITNKPGFLRTQLGL
ncbi:MAG: glycerophosphodiester phosphodiesterase family protein [Chloroflexota bacterium]|jgi:glycerophosphoryl diester phosphodiesterase